MGHADFLVRAEALTASTSVYNEYYEFLDMKMLWHHNKPLGFLGLESMTTFRPAQFFGVRGSSIFWCMGRTEYYV